MWSESPVPPATAAPLQVGTLAATGVPGAGALLLGLQVSLPVRPLAVVGLQVEAGVVARRPGSVAQTVSVVLRKVVLQDYH